MSVTPRDKQHKRSQRVRTRLRKVSSGKPRLSVFRSSKNIYAQVIDDTAGRTLAAASSVEEAAGLERGSNRDAAAAVGRLIAERAKAAGVDALVFDRGGYLYHGRVKAPADAAREAGPTF